MTDSTKNNNTVKNDLVEKNHIDVLEKNEFRMKVLGVFTEILLSTELFKNNKELLPFINNLFSKKFRDYLFRSRTQLLARSIRIIYKMNDEELQLFHKDLLRFVSLAESSKDTDSKPTSDKKDDDGFVDYWTKVIQNIKI